MAPYPFTTLLISQSVIVCTCRCDVRGRRQHLDPLDLDAQRRVR